MKSSVKIFGMECDDFWQVEFEVEFETREVEFGVEFATREVEFEVEFETREVEFSRHELKTHH